MSHDYRWDVFILICHEGVSDMRISIVFAALLFLFSFICIETAFSHSGRTNSAGCHTNHQTGGYHCHNSGTGSSNQVTYCHVVGGEDRCGYALSTCNSLIQRYGGWCRLNN